MSISSFEMAAIAALLAGCSTGTCIRNSDCLSAEMCMQGECVAIATEAGVADAAIDAARADAGVVRNDAGRRDAGPAADAAASVDASANLDGSAFDASIARADAEIAEDARVSVPIDAATDAAPTSAPADAGVPDAS